MEISETWDCKRNGDLGSKESFFGRLFMGENGETSRIRATSVLFDSAFSVPLFKLHAEWRWRAHETVDFLGGVGQRQCQRLERSFEYLKLTLLNHWSVSVLRPGWPKAAVLVSVRYVVTSKRQWYVHLKDSSVRVLVQEGGLTSQTPRIRVRKSNYEQAEFLAGHAERVRSGNCAKTISIAGAKTLRMIIGG